MPSNPEWRASLFCLALTDAVVGALRAVVSRDELVLLMEAIAREMGFRHYALIHHDDLGEVRPDRADLKDYPAAIAERLSGQRRYRRDPVIRGCIFADSAFLWSELYCFIHLDRQDRASFELDAREGLNEGITVPYVRLGERMGSGTFAFQAASRPVSGARLMASTSLKLHPRPRDCVVLAGRSYSNKQIARAIALTPRTVDGYLTEARRLFDARDRTELVVGAVLAGEVGLHELARRQPE